MKKIYITNEKKRKDLLIELFKVIMVLFFLSNIFSCASGKVESKKIEKQKMKSEKEIDVQLPKIDSQPPLPEILEKVSLSRFKKYKMPNHVLATEDFLWLVFRKHTDVVSSKGKKTFQYEPLAKIDGLVQGFVVHETHLSWRSSSVSLEDIWHVDSGVILRFDSLYLYYFTVDGAFVKKTKIPENWWEVKQGEYAKYNWTIEGESPRYLAFGHRKLPPTGNRRIPRKKVSGSHYVFAGPWIILRQWERTPPGRQKLVLVNRRTAELGAEFKYWKRDKSSDSRYDFRAHEKGIYVDRHGGRDDNEITPVRWFGERVVELDHGPDVFCYVFKGAKKCIDNADHQLRDVIEMDNYRVFRTDDYLYIEGMDNPNLHRTPFR